MAFSTVAIAVTPEVHILGTGSDVSYVVIQEKSLSAAPLIFAYRYNYASNPPMTGDALLAVISANYPELQIQTTQYPFGKSLDAFDVQGTTVSSSTAPDGNSGSYWSYYVSGGYDGSGSIGTNGWSYSQCGFDSRTIVPGSCDGWIFASWQGTNEPSDAPPSLDVNDVASLVAAATANPTPTPAPTSAPVADTSPLAISVGRGPDVSYVVIQEPTLSSRPIVFAYHYTNASSPPINGYQLLLAIHAGYPDFDFATTQYSFGKSLDAFRFGGATVSSSTAPDGNGGYYWSYYLFGGYDGSGGVGTNGWTYSQDGFENRTITPGSCDGWTLASWQGTNGMDVPPTIDPTFLASLAVGSAAQPAVTSASPTPESSPKVVVNPIASPGGTPSPTPSSTPQISGGGGTVSGGVIPATVPRSLTQGAESHSAEMPGPLAHGSSCDSPAQDVGVHAVCIQEGSPVMAFFGQGGYEAPAWLRAGGFLASVNLSPPSGQPSDTGLGLKLLKPFQAEKLPLRNPEYFSRPIASDPLQASHASGVGAAIPVNKAEGLLPGFFHRITGQIGRFWKSLLQVFQLTPS